MLPRARTSAPGPRSVLVLALVVSLAAATAAGTGVVASAESPEPSTVEVRTVTVTADDVVAAASVDEELVADALQGALRARVDLTAADPGPAATSVDPEVWDRVAQCESGQNWSINTGNGFYGGLQFELRSWRWVGGTGYPHEASKAEQIRRAEMLLERQGWMAWPSCSRQLGLR